MRNCKYFFLLPISIILCSVRCNPSPGPYPDGSGNWVAINNPLPADARNGAACFVVGDNAYISTGFNQTKNKKYADIWSFNPTNGWTQMASAPVSFLPRSNAVAFAIGTNGYISCGEDVANNFLKDTWQYNTLTNAWTRKSDFGGNPRIDASAFAIGNYGYIICGYNGTTALKDSWVYDANADTWSLTTVQFSGARRMGAVVFVYKSKAYIVTGIDNGGGGLVNDLIVFDPSNTSTPWTQKRNITNTSIDSYDDDYTDIVRDHAVGFVLGDSAYITTGSNGGYNNKTWGYDFKDDIWFRKTTFEKAGRANSIGFTIAGRSYITTGRSSTQDLDDLNQWFPYQTYNVND